MDYITTREAAGKWGVTNRLVQLLCQKGSVDGAIRFNRSYAIPADAPRPRDARRRGEPDMAAADRPATKEVDPSVFREMFDRFPFRINITDAEGFMVYANHAFMEGTLDGVAEASIGQYNILKEESLERWGLDEHIRRAFTGETVFTPNLEFPNRGMVGTRYKKEYAFLSLYHDVSSFPLFEGDRLAYVVSVFIPVRRLRERREVQRGREHIESHWREPFCAAAAARAAGLSPSRFVRMFREDAGFTPREYYLEVRFTHIREALQDVNLSVAQAFAACGTDYNSHHVAQFRKHVGMSPSHYRKTHIKTV